MQFALPAQFLGTSFRRSADMEAYRRAQHYQHVEKDHERKQKQEDARNDVADLADFTGTAISIEQAETFRLELDTYDTATVDALIANQEALDLASQRLADTLAQAHMLEDGRRVFKTEDGLSVFDEFGDEVAPEVIAPEQIPDHHPRAETYFGQLEDVRALQQEQTELLDFQAELDSAAERLDSGDMTVEEYDELRGELRNNAPDAVRARLSGLEPQEISPSIPAPAQFTDQTDALDLDADLAAAIQPAVPSLGG